MIEPVLAFACFLLNVAVPSCDVRAQDYVAQAEQIPACHRAMIASISLWEMPNGDAGPISKTIRLPATDLWDHTVLAHETGHIVVATLHLCGAYREAFWVDGVAQGRTTPYGRTNVFEDQAECYAAIIRRALWVCSPERVRWLRQYAFAGTEFAEVT